MHNTPLIRQTTKRAFANHVTQYLINNNFVKADFSYNVAIN